MRSRDSGRRPLAHTRGEEGEVAGGGGRVGKKEGKREREEGQLRERRMEDEMEEMKQAGNMKEIPPTPV